MLRIARFGGIVTYASPYAIPPGGATQQVNITCSVPGQLTTRGGMHPVTFSGGRVLAGVVTQVFTAPGGVGRGDKLILVGSDGAVTLTSAVA
jgi:hypothetical protein